MLPLHRDAQTFADQSSATPQTAHAGLWFDRFYNRYDADCSVPKNDSGKLAWIQSVCASPVGDQAILETHRKRQEVLALSLDGKAFSMETNWHFVTGMGNNHPVENGFAWHPTLGVPYLTGAAVKGILRAWCEVWALDTVDAATCLTWFGPSAKDLKGGMDGATGGLIFFDAIPTGQVRLKPDVMTPHYGKWYANGDTDPMNPEVTPADWHDPVPVPFLVVDKGQTFQFAIAPRAGSETGLDDVKQAKELLIEALQWVGAGAKTSAGYGRMRSAEQMAEEAEALQRSQWLISKISELAQTLHAPEDDILRGKPLADAWNVIEDADTRQQALNEIRERWSEKGWWENPPGKSSRRARAVYDSPGNDAS